MPSCKICNNPKTQFLHRLKNFSYYFCLNCQTLFLYPPPRKRQIGKYYSASFDYPAGKTNESNIRTRAKIILRNLKKLNPGGQSLLDVGSGFGYFLDEAKKIGLSPLGLEPSHKLSAASAKHLINVLALTFDDYYKKNKNRQFDFITLIHVIEHLTNPKQAIDRAIKLLNPKGILFIETPNLNSHLFKTEKQNYTFLTPPDHLWIFSAKSFAQILQNHPQVKIVKVSSFSYPEHLMGIIKQKLKGNDYLSAKKNTKNVAYASALTHPSSPTIQPRSATLSSVKYLLFDRLLAPVFTPFLNFGGYGSILELYVRKL